MPLVTVISSLLTRTISQSHGSNQSTQYRARDMPHIVIYDQTIRPFLKYFLIKIGPSFQFLENSLS